MTPNWQLSNLDGSPVPALREFQGQPVLLLFWSVGCPGCKSRALPVARQLHRSYPRLQIFAIHTQLEGSRYSRGQIDEIRQLLKLEFPVLVDEGKKSWESFAAEGTPHWVLLDEEGAIVRSVFGSMPNALHRVDYALREMEESGAL